MAEKQLLSDEQLQKIFNELKGKNSKRDFITFQDFRNAIVHFKLQLMRGLPQNSPEFNEYCKELFIMICSDQTVLHEEKPNEEQPSQNVGERSKSKNMEKQPRQISQQKRSQAGLGQVSVNQGQGNLPQKSNTQRVQRPSGKALNKQISNQMIQHDKNKAQYKKNFGDKNSQIPIQSVQLNFETFKEKYKKFATLRNISYLLHERLYQIQSGMFSFNEMGVLQRNTSKANLHNSINQAKQQSAKKRLAKTDQEKFPKTNTNVQEEIKDQASCQVHMEDDQILHLGYVEIQIDEEDMFEGDEANEIEFHDANFEEEDFYEYGGSWSDRDFKRGNSKQDYMQNPLNEMNDEDPDAYYSKFDESRNCSDLRAYSQVKTKPEELKGSIVFDGNKEIEFNKTQNIRLITGDNEKSQTQRLNHRYEEQENGMLSDATHEKLYLTNEDDRSAPPFQRKRTTNNKLEVEDEEDRKLEDFESIMISHHKKSYPGSMVKIVELEEGKGEENPNGENQEQQKEDIKTSKQVKKEKKKDIKADKQSKKDPKKKNAGCCACSIF